MAKLTICMPVSRCATHFSEALESVLLQKDVDFEIIVVTPEKIELPGDPRISQMVCSRKSALTQAFHASTSPFFAVAGCNDVLLPGAFRQVLNAFEDWPDAGMLHCCYFLIDGNGNASRERSRKLRDFFELQQTPEFDLKSELIVSGLFMSRFRAFRREVVNACGGFDPEMPDAVFDLAIKIADRFAIRLVPQYLYCRRSTNIRSHWENFRVWRTRTANVMHLRRTGKVQFLMDWKYPAILLLLLAGFWKAMEWGPVMKRIWRRLRRRLRVRRLLIASFDTFYDYVLGWSFWSRFVRISSKQRISSEKDPIAYYLWRFPVLSQTFIHRELDALRRSGVSVVIVAEGKESIENADAKARSLLQDTCFVNEDLAKISSYRKYFWRARPFTCLKILLFLMTRRYSRFKSVHKDLKVFTKALCLAGELKEKNVRRIHAPWGDETALVALLASRLLNTGYSVQVRAHELYRAHYQYGLNERLTNADFIVTNTVYNQLHLNSLVAGKCKVLQIYNGVDLLNLRPPEDRPHHNPLKIVCTARLIEQKGIEYLLKSCSKLKNAGYRFLCEILGGPEPSLYANYYLMLKKMYRRLALEDTVIFAGELPFEAVLDRYRTADLFVLPSVIASDGSRDIIPNVLLEAMATELAVISTQVGGIPEIVENEVNGLLVPPANEEALTQAITRLMDDPVLRKRLGVNARKRVEQQFDIEKNISKYLRAFTGNL